MPLITKAFFISTMKIAIKLRENVKELIAAKESKIVAIATLDLSSDIQILGFKVITSRYDKNFVVKIPSRKGVNNNYYPLIKFSNELEKKIMEKILEKFLKALALKKNEKSSSY